MLTFQRKRLKWEMCHSRDYNDIQLQFFDSFRFFSKKLRICVWNLTPGKHRDTQHARWVTSNILLTQKWLQELKVRLHFPLTFSLSWLLNLSSLSHAFIKLPIIKKILSKKIVHKRNIYEWIVSSSMTWSFNLSCISASKKGNGVLRHFKDVSVISLNPFFSQNRGRSSLVNRSKTGVIVNLRRGNLTSMCD